MATLEETLAQGVKDQKIPHAVVFATNADGSWTYKHATGNHIHGTDGAIGEDAEFMLASQTKLLTTIAVLQVVEKGLIGLDDDVAEQIPELAEQKIIHGFDADDKPILVERKNAINLRLLLTHSAGCGYEAIVPDLLKYNQQRDPSWMPNTQKTVVERFACPLIYEPGASWSYGSGIDWAGKAIERVTDQTLEQLVRTGICDPLGAESITFFPYEDAALGGRVPGRTIRMPDGNLTLHTEPFMNIDPIDAMGGHGAYGTLEDYQKVMRSILANDGALLRPETVESMFTPQLTPEASRALSATIKTPLAALFIGEWKPELELNWGLGGILLMADADGRRKKGSLAWGGVANTFWMIDRQADLAVTFGTQVLPPGDKGPEEMISAVEFDMYQKKGIKF